MEKIWLKIGFGNWVIDNDNFGHTNLVWTYHPPNATAPIKVDYVDRKMAKNRAREWDIQPDGIRRHK